MYTCFVTMRTQISRQGNSVYGSEKVEQEAFWD